jgi:hypothetical protein
VGFTWCRKVSIKRITARDAQRQLLNLSPREPHIEIQLERLAALPESAPLAKVQRPPPSVHANMVWSVPGISEPRRLTRAASLPFLIEGDHWPKHPADVLPPAPHEDGCRLARADRRIHHEPFLPSIRVHRYVSEA